MRASKSLTSQTSPHCRYYAQGPHTSNIYGFIASQIKPRLLVYFALKRPALGKRREGGGGKEAFFSDQIRNYSCGSSVQENISRPPPPPAGSKTRRPSCGNYTFAVVVELVYGLWSGGRVVKPGYLLEVLGRRVLFFLSSKEKHASVCRRCFGIIGRNFIYFTGCCQVLSRGPVPKVTINASSFRDCKHKKILTNTSNCLTVTYDPAL